MKRRQLLATGASALAIALAGCSSTDGDGGMDTTTTETATDTPTTTATTTEASTPTTEQTTTPTTTTQSSGDPTVVSVAPGGSLEFDPEQVTVSSGTTVRWEWDGSGHNVRPASQPADANWSGTEGGDGTTYNSGHTYEFTFEAPGTYDYYCAPHRSVGMTGTLIVE